MADVLAVVFANREVEAKSAVVKAEAVSVFVKTFIFDFLPLMTEPDEEFRTAVIINRNEPKNSV